MTAAIVVLTAVLVLVTGYYAWQTRRAVQTAEKAVRLALAPLIVPRGDFDHNQLLQGPQHTPLEIYNPGPGAAFEVTVEASYQNYVLAGRLEVLGTRESALVSLKVTSDQRTYPQASPSDFDLFVALTFHDALGREFHTTAKWAYVRKDAPSRYWYDIKVEGPDLR